MKYSFTLPANVTVEIPDLDDNVLQQTKPGTVAKEVAVPVPATVEEPQNIISARNKIR